MMDSRITQPLIKRNGTFEEISFTDAFDYLSLKVKSVSEEQNLFFAGGMYANEELYLIQKLARLGVHSNAIASFEYLDTPNFPLFDKNDIVPFAELFGASRFYGLGFNPSSQFETLKSVLHIMELLPNTPTYFFNQPDTLNIKFYASFFRAINYLLVSENLAKGIYINGLGKNYNAYKEQLLNESLTELLAANSLTRQEIMYFIEQLLEDKNPVFIYWEKSMTVQALYELENMCMLLDIQSKQSSGFLGIKSSINSQGLFDMGIFSGLSVGGVPYNEEECAKIESYFQQTIPHQVVDVKKALLTNQFKNGFIFGENPLSDCQDERVLTAIKALPFKVVHTFSMTETAEQADLILPATYPNESEGSYTDSARMVHHVKPDTTSPVALNNLQQLSELMTCFGLPKINSASEAFLEYVSFLPTGCKSHQRHYFRS